MAAISLVALVVAGCTGDDLERSESAQPRSPPASAAVDASAGRAVALQAELTSQLQVRTLLLVERAAGGADVGSALDARRTAVVETLLAAGDVPGGDRLEEALADEEHLLFDHSAAPDLVSLLRARARRPGVQQELAVAVSELTGGRLPVDVAVPLAIAHVDALLEVVDAAQRLERSLAVAIEASLRATERLVLPLVLALSAELGLDGEPGGDASVLRARLATAFVQECFAAASGALASSAATGHGAVAADRLVVVVQRFYGAEVAAQLGAAWTAHHDATAELLAALAAQEAAGDQRQSPPGAELDVAAAREEAEQVAGRLASLLASTVGDEAVGPLAKDLLEEHRSALEVLRMGAGRGPSAAAWRSAADSSLRLADLAAALASAAARQRSLG